GVCAGYRRLKGRVDDARVRSKHVTGRQPHVIGAASIGTAGQSGYHLTASAALLGIGCDVLVPALPVVTAISIPASLDDASPRALTFVSRMNSLTCVRTLAIHQSRIVPAMLLRPALSQSVS